MRNIVFVMIAKGHSIRIANKNKLEFHGRPMFLWNIIKCKKISKKFYFNSDDVEMIKLAKANKVNVILRDLNLCDDHIPSRIIFKSCIKNLPKNTDAIISIQANSPNIDPQLIKNAYNIMKYTNIDELLTCGLDKKIHASIWGASIRRIKKYNSDIRITDREIFKPDCIMLDKAIDIHTRSDLAVARKSFKKNRGY